MTWIAWPYFLVFQILGFFHRFLCFLTFCSHIALLCSPQSIPCLLCPIILHSQCLARLQPLKNRTTATFSLIWRTSRFAAEHPRCYHCQRPVSYSAGFPQPRNPFLMFLSNSYGNPSTDHCTLPLGDLVSYALSLPKPSDKKAKHATHKLTYILS